MWDLLVTLGNLIIIPAMLSMVLNPNTYVPRTTSLVSVAGLSLVIAGLIGAGLFFSTIVLLVIASMWVFLLLFRSTPPAPADAD